MKITVKEAAKVVGEALERPFSVQTVYTWIHSGKLPVIKVGRSVYIQSEDLEIFLGKNPESVSLDARKP
jgi:excisionase family DNA binding protein